MNCAVVDILGGNMNQAFVHTLKSAVVFGFIMLAAIRTARIVVSKWK